MGSKYIQLLGYAAGVATQVEGICRFLLGLTPNIVNPERLMKTRCPMWFVVISQNTKSNPAWKSRNEL
ncbi:MAG TPA: hypothetical protein PKB09_02535 [Candidatus Saccharibacteria bacterium]|nr:hypothetical protein [Candidatus Saccharibacteria bacterium]